MRGDFFQKLLIFSGFLVTSLFGVFFYREMFPEYRIYQKDYVALEEFHSTYTHQAPPPFQFGIKQIVLEKEDKGPAIIDRCTSCHVALQIPYFSPTKIAYDVNGNMMRTIEGKPLLIKNEEYIWHKLDQKILELRDKAVIENLESQGLTSEVKKRLKTAEEYESLKVAHVGDHVYDVTKALKMHPLIGTETRPFEFHPIEDYGCTSCHSGNGRGLVTDKAHGPVFDGQYDIESTGHDRSLIDSDKENDPPFAHVFNHKPGEHLLFQTDPILVGALIEAKCIQCHQTSDQQIKDAVTVASDLVQQRQDNLKRIQNAFEEEKQHLISLLKIEKFIRTIGYEETIKKLKKDQNDYALSALELEYISSQLKYLEENSLSVHGKTDPQLVLKKVDQDLIELIGNETAVEILKMEFDQLGENAIDRFLESEQESLFENGSLYNKKSAYLRQKEAFEQASQVTQSLDNAKQSSMNGKVLRSELDELTSHYHKGEELYISQACYACHRIAGFSRGGIGPELTLAGHLYPWYLKKKIIWPQGELPTSTMPTMRLDHQEVENIMTFLLAQRNDGKAVAEAAHRANIQAWEAGRKQDWEKSISPVQIYDLKDSMTAFATEGCAACHRLQGFESDIGFKIEKATSNFDEIYEQQQWFKKIFPEVVHISRYDEELSGSMLVSKIEEYSSEIDEKIVSDVRKNSFLEELSQKHPDLIESFYSSFRYAMRAKDHEYSSLVQSENDPKKQLTIKKEWDAWKDRVHRVLMMYIQTYGFGRLIGPHLNWTGIYRTDEWLMEHFKNPSGHVPRSIMPVFPFDESKFYALTNLLDVLAIQNRNQTRNIWKNKGFNPAEAYEIHCAQCHGVSMYGNGVISEWIYPIPKNLRQAEFLRNLTREKIAYSITHGVKGTPMAPWGEVAEDKPQAIADKIHHIPVLTKPEIDYLVDWLFASLAGGEVIKQDTVVPKWNYSPQDVLNELQKERGKLLPSTEEKENQKLQQTDPKNRHLQENGETNPIQFVSPEVSGPTKSPVGKSISQSYQKDPIYYVSLNPIIYTNPKVESASMTTKSNSIEEINDIFDVVDKPTESDSKSYYIKRKYYTSDNIEEGRKFFLINCAYCHGNEGDGSGIRSGVMAGAKPRMLTNLDWIHSKDDLRLIRSIKYGVPGTSMTPWGDFTSSLQRLQLVMFIRSLTEEKNRRDELNQTLYQTFDIPKITVNEARIDHLKQFEVLRNELNELRMQQKKLDREILSGELSPEKTDLNFYLKSFEIEKNMEKLTSYDALFVEINELIKKKRDIYFNYGVSLISKNVSDEILKNYLKIIQFNELSLEFNKKGLRVSSKDPAKEIRIYRDKIVNEFELQISELEKNRAIIEGKIRSAKQQEELQENSTLITNLNKLKNKLINDTEEAIRLSEKKREIFQKLSTEKEKGQNSLTNQNHSS